MTPLDIGAAGIVALVVLVLLRMPVAPALGLVGFVGYAAIDGWTRAGLTAGAAPLELAHSYGFSVVPLFTLMGTLAAISGLSADLFRAATAVSRGARGSLSIAAIFASGLFGAICGSSVATALTMSRVSVPQMLGAGYPPAVATGAVAAGGTLGILIPPSLILMIYAIIAQLPVDVLFAAALVPGVALMGLYCVVAFGIGRGAGERDGAEPAAAPPLLRSLARIWHVALLFGLSVGGIYAGWFTPTEAAAVGAAGALLLALLTGRSSLREVVAAFLETARLVSSVIFIVMGSTIFSYFIVQSGLSQAIAAGVSGAGFGPTGVILLLCAVYIVLGCFLEGVAMILITVPIALPLIQAQGIDLVWFGVLLVILIEIGLVTPPMGMNLFVIRAVNPEVPLAAIYRGVAPFLAAPLVLIAALILFPGLALWLPEILR